ncbi:MAG: hypothetical protein ABEJ24_01835 [Candidatus Magasanikbacteria bacterium]
MDLLEELEDKIKPTRLERVALTILKITVGITFIWIGVMITIEPGVWKGFFPEFLLQLEYSQELMFVFGVFDFLLGLFLVIDRFTPVVSLLASLHLLGILIFYGIDSITIRDVGLLGATICIFLFSISYRFKQNN